VRLWPKPILPTNSSVAVRWGDPGTQILRFARLMRSDPIVMGAPDADRPEL
jgi:hypothetical protein